MNLNKSEFKKQYSEFRKKLRELSKKSNSESYVQFYCESDFKTFKFKTCFPVSIKIELYKSGNLKKEIKYCRGIIC